MGKDHILNEIRRTALANSGKSLGRSRFLQETGIKDSDWLEKIWPRWSAAVEEAGFSPLTLQGKNDRTLAIRKVAEFARRLGRFATVPEMLIEKRSDPSFPNEKAVIRRCGGQGRTRRRGARLLPIDTGFFEDTREILAKTLPARKQREGGEIAGDKTRDGYVYLSSAPARNTRSDTL